MREGRTGLDYEKAGRKRTEQDCAVINMIKHKFTFGKDNKKILQVCRSMSFRLPDDLQMWRDSIVREWT